MHNCEYCDRGFKTIQGLLGHQRMKHSASTAQHSGEYRPSADLSSGEHSGEYRPSADLNTAQHCAECSCGTGEYRQYREEQSQEVLIEEHPHSLECSGCQQMAKAWRVAGIKEIAEIPGVSEAVVFAKESEQWNAEHPDRPPTIENWALVEQVQELVDGSRPKPIRIVKTEEPLIRITELEGQLIGQQVAEIIRQNYE